MLIGFQNVTFEFGARVIVEDATWHIQPGDRIGLIGYNGTGKSTLLKVLVGEYTPSKGTVEKSKETTIGYLHQDLLSFDTNDNITEVALSAFERVRELEKEIEQLGHALEKDSENEELLIRYTDALHELDVLDGYNIHRKAEEVLHGLGFSNEDLVRPYKEFSGGWRMRVLLAKMILQQPDVLLMDEPTNHLDLPSIEWLEKYLLHYKGSVVIVSHDKFFLNRMVNKIVELYQQQLHIYSGDYEFYEQEKMIRIDMQQKAYENQQDYIRQQERFIERFKAKASKAAQAQSVQKRLDKIEKIEDVKLERPDLRINFQLDKVPGKILVHLKDVSKSFGKLNIVDHTSAEIERGDKIALIGANGKGKSTVLRMIAGTEKFDGERVWGHNVEESFYAQHQLEALTLNNNLLEELQQCGSKKTDVELRALLGAFLFSGDDVDKKIKVLSGGEKARVALAKTIVSKANFLLLDEPTNHLDMHSVELLAEALNKYEGSYILVSHDRYFISKTANKIWEIVDHQIKEFKGTYQEWVDWNERMARINAEKQKQGITDSKPEPAPVAKPVVAEKQTTPAPINRELQKELQKEQRRLTNLETQLTKAKEEESRFEQALGDPDNYADKGKFVQIEADYTKAKKERERLEKEYETAFEKVLELESQL
ncbi:MAG: ATP-binding cassette domain-containing protein [Chitinophagaceae bacterium]|nr:ATP-binding cassette domain-containing protein [Chitinophagaceae bacterium]MCA6451764.1 ATP-binding cassette domain-containing protein [Chitinophagaceae bacterium]MCA6454927.1 ATP-binding cassette domain-containing protein [Chitinophagaceae bacterium]MCA6458494.1 ATP-binding cassette domain-containing protein [Chitinophagaceae bacterium]MCA6465090.1 ATP-binding cassette domain-containing protein [Chitinophagaceae bacterium]